MGNENGSPEIENDGRMGSSRPWRSHPSIKLILGMILSSLILIQNPYSTPAASLTNLAEVYSSNIEGTVVEKDSGLPITGANISLQSLYLQTTTDHQGAFKFLDLSIPVSEHRTTVSISALGYGEWRMEDAMLLPDDTLILDVHLSTSPVTIVIPELFPSERPEPAPQSPLELEFQGIDQTNAPLPETIRVRITGEVGTCDHDLPYTVEVIDFMDYVKHVLPYEWILSWPRESLRAGAMAAKMYAWEIVADGGRYEDADVYDSICDQVYIPDATYASTNKAIEFTWFWRLTRSDGSLFRTHYMDWYWRCESYGAYFIGRCMGQWDTFHQSTGNAGYAKLTWDEMLFQYYWDSELSYIPTLPPGSHYLRFFGNGWGDIDRVKILIDDPSSGHLPIDVGATDFTFEWWMQALGTDNQSSTCSPGNDNWTNGNVIFDRDVQGSGDFGEYGISLSAGTIAFGVNNGSTSETLCGSINVADGVWNHIAVTRSVNDGEMKIFIDGQLDQATIGPTGDISYRDGRSSGMPEQDPYLIIGARKSDLGLAYNGYLDEIRVSTVIRYTENFQPPIGPFSTDGQTVGLYHFDEGFGNSITDLSTATGGPSDGIRNYGGDPENGPEWGVSTLFLNHRVYLPMFLR
jgi:hypothetical protein